MKRRCSTCRFSDWKTTPHCRRFPPTALGVSNCAFPIVDAEKTWCHEHRFSLPKWLKLKFKHKQPELIPYDQA